MRRLERRWGLLSMEAAARDELTLMGNEKRLRIGVLGATFETPNMGVGALAAGGIKCVLSEYPGADVFFLDYGRDGTVRTVQVNGRRIQVPLVNMRFSKKFYLPNNIVVLLLAAVLLKIVPLPRLRQWLADRNRCLGEISRADLFASIAGGDSFSDIYGLGRFLYVALPQILVILLGKRLILLPQTYGPFKGRLSKSIARYIVARAERAYCRDYRSLGELTGAARGGRPQGQFAFCHDMAFGLDPVAPAKVVVEGLPLTPKRDRVMVGFNISGLLFMGGYTRNNVFGLRFDYRDMVHELIDFLISKKGVSVLLVPHVFGTDPRSESDVPACEQIFGALSSKYPGRLGILRGSYDQNEIKYVIGLCDFFIGSRMHACIAAVSQHVPAVAIAYSSKFLGVMETIGIASLAADARKLGAEEIRAAIDQAFDSRRRIAEELRTKMPEVKETVRCLFRPIPVGSGPVASSQPQEAFEVGAR